MLNKQQKWLSNKCVFKSFSPESVFTEVNKMRHHICFNSNITRLDVCFYYACNFNMHICLDEASFA